MSTRMTPSGAREADVGDKIINYSYQMEDLINN